MTFEQGFVDKRGWNCRGSWTLSINGHAAIKVRKELGLDCNLSGRPERRDRSQKYKIEGKFVWVRLKGISEIAHVPRVYDIEVDDSNHSFETVAGAVANSEAANIKDANAFSSLLPALSYDPTTIRIIESTPRGKQGPGAEFYERCEKARRGISEEELVFLSWLDDPGCVRDPEEAEDAPATDMERELMTDFKATKAQIAWSRWCFETQCNGIENRFFSEYPYCYSVAFTSSAYPAFEQEEIRRARKTVRDPVARGFFDLEDGRPRFKPSRSGTWLIWENPQEGHEYFLGADAARGKLSQDSEAIGDFAAVSIFDGSTGRQVARFADRISPDTFSRMIYAAGIAYNEALVNIELTGGWGRWAQKELRDKYYYSNLYGWKGKDDRMIPGKRSNLAGWETTSTSRDRMYNAFRAKLRSRSITIRDEELLHQMSAAEMYYGRWEVEKMHDDILVSAFLAVVAISDYAPVEVESKASEEDEPQPELSDDILLGSEPQQAILSHWEGIQNQIENGGGEPWQFPI